MDICVNGNPPPALPSLRCSGGTSPQSPAYDPPQPENLVSSVSRLVGLKAFPGSTDVGLLELVLCLLLVAILALLNFPHELLLHSLYHLLITYYKKPSFFLKESLYVRINPGFNVGKTPYSTNGYSVIHTEIKIVQYAAGQTASALPIRMHTVLPTLLSLNSLSSDSSVHFFTVQVTAGCQTFAHRQEMRQVVVRAPEGMECWWTVYLLVVVMN